MDKIRFFLYLCKVIRLGSLVNRASDSGSEGRAFESHRGHFFILTVQNNYVVKLEKYYKTTRFINTQTVIMGYGFGQFRLEKK